MPQSGGASPSPGQQNFAGQGPMLDDKKKKMQPRKRVSFETVYMLEHNCIFCVLAFL
jgi:hypothetical protein